MSGDTVGSSNITLGLSVDNASLIQSTSTIVNAIEQITETIRVSNQNNRLVAVNDEDIAAITESYNTRITQVNAFYEAEASAIQRNVNLSSQERERAATETRSNHEHAIRFLEEQRLKRQEALVQASPRATSQQSLAFSEVAENWQAVDATNQSLASYRQIESVLNGIAASEKSRMTDAELAERRSTDRIADINRSYQARILALGNVNALMNSEEQSALVLVEIERQRAVVAIEQESSRKALLAVDKQLESAAYSRMTAEERIAATAASQRAAINAASGATNAERAYARNRVLEESKSALAALETTKQTELEESAKRNLLAVEKELNAAAYSRLDALGKIAATAASRTAAVDASGATDVDKDAAYKKIQAEEAAAIAALKITEQTALEESAKRTLLGVEKEIEAAAYSRMTAEERIAATADRQRAAINAAIGATDAQKKAAILLVEREEVVSKILLLQSVEKEKLAAASRVVLGIERELEAAAYSRLSAQEKVTATAASRIAAVYASDASPADRNSLIVKIESEQAAAHEALLKQEQAEGSRVILGIEQQITAAVDARRTAEEKIKAIAFSRAATIHASGADPAEITAALQRVEIEKQSALAALATTKQTELEESAKRTLLGVQKEIEAAAYSRLTVEQKIAATADRQRAAIYAVLGATNAQKDAARDIVDQEERVAITLLRQSVEKEKIAEASRNLLAVEKEIEAAAYSRLDAEGKIAATAASRVASIRASGATPAQQDAAITRVDNEYLEATTELHRRNAVQLQEQLNSRYLNSLPTLERIQKYHEKNIEQINRQIALTHQERDALIQTANQLRDNQLQKAGQGHSSSEQADRTRNQMMQEFGRGFEDFVVSASMAKTTTEGLAMGLRGAANNISQMAAASGAFVGAIVAVGVSLSTVLVPMAIKFVESFHEALESVDEFKQRLTKGAESEGKHVERQQELDKMGTSGTGKDVESQMKKSIDLLKEKLLAQQAVSKKASEDAVLADKNVKEEQKKLKETNDSYLVLGATHQALTNYGLYKKPIDEVDNPARQKEGNTAFERSEPAAVVLDLALSPITGAFVAANAFGQWFANTAPKVDDAIAKKKAANEVASKALQEELEITKHIADIEAHAVEIKNAGAVKYLEELGKQRDKELEKSEFGKFSGPAIIARQEKELSDFDQLTGDLKDPIEKEKRTTERTAIKGRHSVEFAKARVNLESTSNKREELMGDTRKVGQYDSSHSSQGVANTYSKRRENERKEINEHDELVLKQALSFEEEKQAIEQSFARTKDEEKMEKDMEDFDAKREDQRAVMATREHLINEKHSKMERRANEDQLIASEKFENSFKTKLEREESERYGRINEEHLKNERLNEDTYIENTAPEEVERIKRELNDKNDQARDRKLDDEKRNNRRLQEDRFQSEQKLGESFGTKAERDKGQGANKIKEEHLKSERAIEDMEIDGTEEKVKERKAELQKQNDKARDRRLAGNKKMEELNEREKTTEEGIDLTKKRMDESGKDTGPTKAFVVGTQDSDKAINRALSGTRTQEDTLKASLKVQQDSLIAIKLAQKNLTTSL